ncbi:MAG: ATPase [Saprospiraceae bacterium]|nr:ATPase [Saprospiraceae bacterium]MCB0681679.1 ATPase [Saprospiraceae bacterium]
MTFLCISTFFKGQAFLRSIKAAGNRVFLITKQSLQHEAWPWEAIDEVFYVEKDDNSPENLHNLALGLAHLLRSQKVDRIVALDDFDVEKAAFLREQFRIPGMGQTTGRYFRDKLAMRMKAAEAGIPVPAFSPLFNDEEIRRFSETVPAPWLVKPRSEASATGITKIHSTEQLWQHLEKLGDERHRYLIEAFKPGDVYHADALSIDGKMEFCRISKYLDTPFEVAHGGGIFRTHTVAFGEEEDQALKALTRRVMDAFGMRSSASHTEFIRSHETGEYVFLETSSRVGGAHIAEMVEASSGLNLWWEWARIEDSVAKGSPYALPPVRNDYAGIIVSLSRFQWPDMSVFSEPEVVWRIEKEYHVGLIVRSNSRERVLALLDDYAERVFRDFHASAPAPDKPTH